MCAAAKTRALRWYQERQAREEDEHLHRLHRRRRASRRARVHARAAASWRKAARAGGMLMGAVANMAPDLFRRHHRRGAVRRRAHHHARCEPAADAAGMARMGQSDRETRPPTRRIAAYSPYDNVRGASLSARCSPLAGLTDPRVTYWEPAKWVARLRATKTDDHLLVLRTNMDAGHAGASGRFARLKEVALSYAFAPPDRGPRRLTLHAKRPFRRKPESSSRAERAKENWTPAFAGATQGDRSCARIAATRSARAISKSISPRSSRPKADSATNKGMRGAERPQSCIQ